MGYFQPESRAHAISAVYGEIQLNANATYKYEGETLTAWMIDGYPTLQSVKKEYSIERLEEIFDRTIKRAHRSS